LDAKLQGGWWEIIMGDEITGFSSDRKLLRHALKEFMVDDADGGVGRKARSQVSGLGAFATSSDFKELSKCQ
jgi:hypothetical protein